MDYTPRKPVRLGAERREVERAAVEEINTHARALATCPECGGKLTHEGGCSNCKACGWSACGV
jgi:ribonucleoside-diphosphate reductase alpha chain